MENFATSIRIKQDEVYEFRTDRSAIELLAGDPILLKYLNGQCRFQVVRKALKESEQEWINQAEQFLLYPDPLIQVSLLPEYDYA